MLVVLVRWKEMLMMWFLFSYLHMLWSGPFQIALALVRDTYEFPPILDSNYFELMLMLMMLVVMSVVFPVGCGWMVMLCGVGCHGVVHTRQRILRKAEQGYSSGPDETQGQQNQGAL